MSKKVLELWQLKWYQYLNKYHFILHILSANKIFVYYIYILYNDLAEAMAYLSIKQFKISTLQGLDTRNFLFLLMYHGYKSLQGIKAWRTTGTKQAFFNFVILPKFCVLCLINILSPYMLHIKGFSDTVANAYLGGIFVLKHLVNFLVQCNNGIFVSFHESHFQFYKNNGNMYNLIFLHKLPLF